VHAFPAAKCVALLSLLIHTDFKYPSTFREQVRFLRDGLRHFTTNLLSYRDIPGALLCKVSFIEFQMSRLDGSTRPNRRPRVPTSDTCFWVNKVVGEGVQKHERVSMLYLSEQIQPLFQVAVLPPHSFDQTHPLSLGVFANVKPIYLIPMADPVEVLQVPTDEFESLNFHDCPSKSFLRKV
jgi:hypothetical protein